MPDLAPFSLPGRFYRGNLHTHCTASDGALPCAQVVERYQAAGYDFLMLSDHFLKRYNWPITDTRRFRGNAFTTILGAEIHAPATASGELWHIVAAGLPLDFAPRARDETGPELARRAAAAGAFIGIAHPAWYQLTVEDGLALDAAHAVEVYNHDCFVECGRGDGWYLLDELSNRGRRLTAFATDDAHFKSEDAFGGWVHVKCESLEPEALVAALRAGHYYASQGPRIHELAIDGAELRVASSPVDSIVVAGKGTGTACRRGHDITEASLDLKKVSGPYFRVSVIDAAGRCAWTHPIWREPS